MKGMGQIVSWSVRDETLHCLSIIRLFRTFIQENPEIWTEELKRDITLICTTIVDHEDAFIDLAFELGGVEGLEAADVKRYIRFIADRRLQQLGLSPIYHIERNPRPGSTGMLNAIEHTNFFENRATEYSRASTARHLGGGLRRSGVLARGANGGGATAPLSLPPPPRQRGGAYEPRVSPAGERSRRHGEATARMLAGGAPAGAAAESAWPNAADDHAPAPLWRRRCRRQSVGTPRRACRVPGGTVAFLLWPSSSLRRREDAGPFAALSP